MTGGLSELGRGLVVLGGVLVVVGLVLVFADKVPFLGRLPGDVVYRKGNVTVYFPIVTSIVLSLLLMLLLNLLRR